MPKSNSNACDPLSGSTRIDQLSSQLRDEIHGSSWFPRREGPGLTTSRAQPPVSESIAASCYPLETGLVPQRAGGQAAVDRALRRWMAEQVYDRRLGLQHGQRMLSRCDHLDDGPLDHAVAEPSYVELWLRTRGRLDRLPRTPPPEVRMDLRTALPSASRSGEWETRVAYILQDRIDCMAYAGPLPATI
jgi:hypothetical protein